MLVLTEYIAQHELKPLKQYFEFQDILEGAKKILKNLATETKAPQKIPGFKFYKVRIGRKTKGRMMVFLATENQKVVPILIRLKKDKIWGMNMAMNNPRVVKQMNNNLRYVLQDIKIKKYQEFEL